MRRFSRQAKILEIIKTNIIETQEELMHSLVQAGFNVTQATVSRDIKELELVKVNYNVDKQRYAKNGNKLGATVKLRELFRTAIISFDCASNVVVIKTIPGMANAASIFVEDLKIEYVVGTVSGFDTVFVLVREEHDSKALIKVLEQIINE